MLDPSGKYTPKSSKFRWLTLWLLKCTGSHFQLVFSIELLDGEALFLAKIDAETRKEQDDGRMEVS